MGSNRKVALITGITGQDGSYLAEFLLGKGYEVHGIVRRSSSFNTGRIKHLYKDSKTHEEPYYVNVIPLDCLSSTDHFYYSTCFGLLHMLEPRVSVQFYSKLVSEYTADVDALGTLRLLDAIKTCGLEKTVKFYEAATSEMFGKVQEIPQKETTPFYPRSPYGVAKVYAYWITVNYRESYGMFACNGILFNHESPRRGDNFVTRKVSRSVAKISLGLAESFELGNLDASRDWGFAKEYVEAMWMMLQQDEPDDYVIATGETHTVREFVELAFSQIGIEIEWFGKGAEEVGKCKKTGITRVKINPKYYRPTEVDELLGDASKAKVKLGWEPKTTFAELVQLMVNSDIQVMKSDPTA
ncbi:unnamed protein product [Notodromas monacha]|uniref:GDP-mannose 4,6-dehydratase n=1 Tax=Notodromas monacha TaxID=399045 RepID=A0A7R9GFA0_9CRUS|nr:unnamed protein product [Notodromas monacha]CAG0919132.1 unnamed protein product [Notodromas monacha]